MKYMKQIGLIFAISCISEMLHEIIPFPIPSSIYGILILFTALEIKLIPLSAIKETCQFLINTMPLMFIPSAVALVDAWALLRLNWMAYSIITALTTFLVMIFAGKVTQAIMHLKK